MNQVIMIGCDLHDRSMLIRYSVGDGEPRQRSFRNDGEGRARMIALLLDVAKRQGATRLVFAYEASGQGYGLCDLLYDHGIECYVLSPTLLPKTPKQAKQKTDPKDAQMLLEQLRGHVLAGNPLPVVWTPPQRVRDDRELVRSRIDAADESTRIKLQILSLLKRRGIEKPGWYSGGWTRRWLAWLRGVAERLDPCVGPVLEGLLDRFEFCRREMARLEGHILKLAATPRYDKAHQEERKIAGVGLLTAMTFLTEMGDLTRFQNRRQVAAYLGLCPASFESGESNNRKGRITRQGPGRLRRMLCQAAWTSLSRDPQAAEAYERIKRGNAQRGKKALVALMRKLGIKMWHHALTAGVSTELEGRGGPVHVRNSPPDRPPRRRRNPVGHATPGACKEQETTACLSLS
jgi:transposase